ncbi:MAG: HDOD domain-containing protein [Desulfobacteraceae bacterium]|nr:HDOD domain-containing protein [Desulfobacteraceae bacterium]
MKNIPDLQEKIIIQKEIIKGIKDLPPYPEIITKAKKAIRSQQSSIGEISDIITNDPALASRVLKLANSSFYNVANQIGSIKYASQILGLTTLGQIIETASLAPLFKEDLKGYAIKPYWFLKHSLFTAFCAKKICSVFLQGYEAEAFTAGLLHDCGKIILSPWIAKYNDIYYSLLEKDFTPIKAETTITGIHHGQTGYAMTKIWNLPYNIQLGVRDHHKQRFQANEKFSAIIKIANLFSQIYFDETNTKPGEFGEINSVFPDIEMSMETIIEISTLAFEYTQETLNRL